MMMSFNTPSSRPGNGVNEALSERLLTGDDGYSLRSEQDATAIPSAEDPEAQQWLHQQNQGYQPRPHPQQLQQNQQQNLQQNIQQRQLGHEEIVVGDVSRGEKQTFKYRDAWAAVLFVLQLFIVAYIGIGWGIPSLKYEAKSSPNDSTDGATGDTTFRFSRLFGFCMTSSTIALLVSACVFTLLMENAKQLVQFSLILTIVCDFLVAVYFIMNKLWFGVWISIGFLGLAAVYTATVWRRVPFAAANLETALTAVRTNGGIALVALGLTVVVNIFYTGLWILAWLGVYVRYTSKDCQVDDGSYPPQRDNEGTCFSHTHPLVVALFAFALLWSWEVGRNVLHVTVSGVVGTWWFAPDDACTFFSPSIVDSLTRATSSSLGSICLGSALTSVLHFCHQVAREARRHGRGNQLLLCILECITVFLERMVTYFNKWAYVYIGLYGYDYLTAGKKVMDLFTARGWTAIINDYLVGRVLSLLSLVIGIITGTIALLLGKMYPGWILGLNSGSGGLLITFLVTFVIGTSIAFILMSVVSSAVDTVMVAFCEAPLEFERNHPGLHLHMIEAWRQVYPDVFGDVGN